MAKIYHADLWGLRETKYEVLSEKDIANTKWKELKPNSPFYFFVPREEGLRGEYEKGWKVTDIFPVNSTGIVTARDHFVIDFEKEKLLERIAEFSDTKIADEEIREKYFSGMGSEKYPDGDTRGWKLPSARKKVQSDKKWKDRIAEILYRPFDIRPIYFTPWMVDWPRPEIMRHMLAGENLALITSRMTKGETFKHAQVTRNIVEVICMSPKTSNNGFVFPLYLYPDEENPQGDLLAEKERKPNLNPKFVEELKEKLGIHTPSFGHPSQEGIPLHRRGERSSGWVTSEQIFFYIYAIFHSPTYRKRYAEFLKIDFPRVPLTSDKKLFKVLSAKGAELVALHLLESPKVENFITKFNVSGSKEVEKVFFEFPSNKRGVPQGTGCVYINKTQYFEGLPKEVWEFQVGGYQVSEKWLKDRKGRKLSADETDHYQKIIVSLSETIRLMNEIDTLIPKWPVN